MKKYIQNFLVVLVIFLFTGLANHSYSQTPPPPPTSGGGTGTGGTDEQRNGAPIDGGLGILLAMGAAYGGRKLYKGWKEKKSEEETDDVA